MTIDLDPATGPDSQLVERIAIRPGHPDCDTARTTVSGTAAPAVVLRPTSADEVAAALRHARAERLPLAIRSGGHNALGFGNIDGGAVLDLTPLDSVELIGDGRVRIGAGATWGAAAAALAEHGLAITSGDTSSVGVGGLVQSGGIGWMVRKHGLTIDSLLAAQVVTASGEVVRASATENADLFWALRGGAGNVGVVTSFELQAQPVRTVHYGTITFGLDDLAGLVTRWGAVMREAPDELTTTLALIPEMGPMPAAAMLGVCLVGDDTAALEPLRALGTVVDDDVSERPYSSILEEAPHPPPHIRPVIGNALVERVDEPLADAIATAYAAGERMVFLRSLGGAVGRVDPEETAFAHRSAEAIVVSAAFLTVDSSEAEVAAVWAVWRTIGDHGIGAYSGFLGSATPDDIAALWPPPTLDRLRQVKRVWDPENTFRRNFNVAP
ncbi:FAD-binding oxidoreductase [Nocardioides ferulae]|uniref:FAD-binding oxidoreductase n=1 Tax=Nocardioides ferulae TaxID=2340821 RepID=UPI000EB50A33|nr:FAD-binding oxidoreductase [Nocardioides ferulae]